MICGLFCFDGVFAQRTIVGTVSDCEGEPLIGAIVEIEEMKIGVDVDKNGFYKIELPKELDTDKLVLIFNCLGMEPKTVNIGKENTINVILEEGPVNCEFYGIQIYK